MEPPPDRFGAGVRAWRSGLGLVRDVVRQELVRRQLAAHVPAGARIRVLDAGCGQGTQAIALARLGHEVVGLDRSEELLGEARRAAATEPAEVRQRLAFVRGDLLDLAPEHLGRYGLVCCHGVAMYLPSLERAVAVLVSAAAPSAVVSVLTRNRAGLAMRSGMSGDWARAVEAFDARTYDNRLGIRDVRADEPGEVRDALAAAGAVPVAWYGVRLFTDHWGPRRPGYDLAPLLDAEEQAGRRDPYRAVAALTHTVAVVEPSHGSGRAGPAQAVFAQPSTEQAKRDPRGKPSPISSRPAPRSNATVLTCHGGSRPSAAPKVSNSPGSSTSFTSARPAEPGRR
ncbi:MAG: class I SAM-dependent methyltransferase [Acidimicrobiales bacterium]